MNNEEKEIDKNSKAYKFAAGKGVMNLPNKLTISRMCMIPVFIALFYIRFPYHYFVALAVFAVACLTDLFDGKIARKYNLVTNLGKFLDPIADKVLVLSALVIVLTVPEFIRAFFTDAGLIAMGCGVAVILAREIIVSGFRMVAASSGAVIAADIFGKYKTVFQDISVVLMIVGAGLWEIFGRHLAVDITNYIWMGFFGIAVILTVISGINYIVKNIQVLKQ